MDRLFVVLIWHGVLIGLAASTYFLLTWGWAAWRKRRFMGSLPPERRVTTWEVIDYVTAHVLVFLTFLLSAPLLFSGQVQPPLSWTEFFARVISTLALDFVAVVRAARWYRARRRARLEGTSHVELLH